LRRRQDEIERLGLRVLVVSFEAPEAAEAYVRETGLPWPLLLDPSRTLYAAYGMGRGSWWQIWGPATWWIYARLIARGRRPRPPTGDVDQLGGDVVIDPAGRVVLHHVGSGPADRPAVSALLDSVRRGSAAAS
jgi:hypothetical protein